MREATANAQAAFGLGRRLVTAAMSTAMPTTMTAATMAMSMPIAPAHSSGRGGGEGGFEKTATAGNSAWRLVHEHLLAEVRLQMWLRVPR